MIKTVDQYNGVADKCKDIFIKKTKDYGTAWRILRTSSLTDQIFIKANRIRTIQETGENKVGESIEDEFVGIVNYCIMSLIQLELTETEELELEPDYVETLYAKHLGETRDLMLRKNHDYGEAWRDMRISSLVDLILMKVLRVKQIEDNMGETIISEGIDANYMDMLNYSMFAMILMAEEKLREG